MNTSDTLYSKEQIDIKAIECAGWIDNIVSSTDAVLCPILQSSFMFLANISSHMLTTPSMDFCGVNRYASDGTIDDLYMYKGVDASIVNNRAIIILDVICNTGATIDFTSKLLRQMGAKKVYSASLLVRQFSKLKPNWTGYTISDETVVGFGIDDNNQYRTLNYIACDN